MRQNSPGLGNEMSILDGFLKTGNEFKIDQPRS